MPEVEECIATVRDDKNDTKNVIFVCRNGLNILPPVEKDKILPNHSYRIKYKRKKSKTGKEFGVLVSYEPIHANEVYQFDIKKDFTKEGMKISGTVQLRCDECGLKTEIPIEKMVTGDYISIDSKLFFIPDSNFVTSPIPVELTQDVDVSVKYVTMATGLLVPIDYIGKEAMERIMQIDKEYSEIVCDATCPSNYSEFLLFEKKIELLKEQITIILNELERAGFKIDDKLTVTITSPDGKTSEFRAYNVDYIGGGLHSMDTFAVEYKGKFAPLGEIVIVKKYLDGKNISEITIDKFNENICIGEKGYRIHKHSCEKKTIIVPEDTRPFETDYILMKIVDITDNIAVPISIAPLTHIKERYRTGYAIIGNKLIEYGKILHYAGKFRLERPTINVYDRQCAVSKNGEIVLYNADGTISTEFSSLNATDIIDVNLTAFFIALYDGIVVPLEYISTETLKKIVEIYIGEQDDVNAAKEISKIVIEELQRKGFRFSYEGECGYEYKATVKAPDGKEGIAKIYTWDGAFYYCCEYGPLAETYCNYKKLNEEKQDEEV